MCCVEIMSLRSIDLRRSLNNLRVLFFIRCVFKFCYFFPPNTIENLRNTTWKSAKICSLSPDAIVLLRRACALTRKRKLLLQLGFLFFPFYWTPQREPIRYLNLVISLSAKASQGPNFTVHNKITETFVNNCHYYIAENRKKCFFLLKKTWTVLA